MIWDYQAQLSRRLLLWGMLSAAAGLGLLIAREEFWRGFGLQAVIWGLIDAVIASFGLRRSGKKLYRRVDLEEASRERISLRRLLWFNAGLDLLYIAGGAALLLLRGGQSDFAAGSGWGIILQGCFLLFFDALHAWRVPEEYVIPDLGILNGPEHKAATLEGGQGAALLVHGFPGTPAEMRELGEALHRQGWTVRLMRLPGHGCGYRSLLQTRAPEWEQAVIEELAILKYTHKPVLLVGYSLGGGLAVPAAAEGRPAGLILLAPFWIDERWWFRMLRFLLRPFLPVAVNPFKRMRLDMMQFHAAIEDVIPDFDFSAEHIQAAMRGFRLPVLFVEQFLHVSRRVRQYAPRMDLPVLVVQAAEDRFVRREATQKLAGWLGRRAVYREVTGDHNLNQTSHSGYAEMERLVLEFAGKILSEPEPAYPQAQGAAQKWER